MPKVELGAVRPWRYLCLSPRPTASVTEGAQPPFTLITLISVEPEEVRNAWNTSPSSPTTSKQR